MEKARKDGWLRACGITFGILVLLALGMMAALRLMCHHMFPHSRYPKLDEIAEISGIKFPSSTRLLDSLHSWVPGGDSWLAAKMVMDRDDADLFIKSLRPSMKLNTETDIDKSYRDTIINAFGMKSALPWWDVGVARKYEVLSSDHKEETFFGVHTCIFISLDNAKQCTVYIMRERLAGG